jgi:hypothetical protein
MRWFVAFASVIAIGVMAFDAGSNRDTRVPSPTTLDTPELHALLSSIDMTVSLIDAYGQCRDEGKTHEKCMQLIRATLEHAKQMIRQ